MRTNQKLYELPLKISPNAHCKLNKENNRHQQDLEKRLLKKEKLQNSFWTFDFNKAL